MKKISITLLFYCVLGMAFYGCCRKEHRLTGSLELDVWGEVFNDSISLVPTITGQFGISDYHEFELASQEYASLGLQQAYAFTPCPLNILNPIDTDLLELYVDQPLALDGVSVAASTNLFEDSTFSQHLSAFNNFDRGTSSIEIGLDSAFFYPPIFTDGPMNIRLVTILEDGTSFENNLDVIIDMQ